MRDIFEELEIEGCPGDPDNESGIKSQSFQLRYGYSFNEEVVFLRASMQPDDTIQDASPEDFPNAEFMLSIDDFKKYAKMVNRFYEQL